MAVETMLAVANLLELRLREKPELPSCPLPSQNSDPGSHSWPLPSPHREHHADVPVSWREAGHAMRGPCHVFWPCLSVSGQGGEAAGSLQTQDGLGRAFEGRATRKPATKGTEP